MVADLRANASIGLLPFASSSRVNRVELGPFDDDLRMTARADHARSVVHTNLERNLPTLNGEDLGRDTNRLSNGHGSDVLHLDGDPERVLVGVQMLIEQLR